MGKKLCLCVVVALASWFLIGLPSSFAAEVYYVGGGGSSGSQEAYSSYTFRQRIKDIVNRSKNMADPKVSGGISGTFTQEVNWQTIGGNEDKSFLRKGMDYRSELMMNIYQKLWSNYRFEGQVFLRKTDDVSVETRRDLRMKSINMRVLNHKNLFEFGDFYGELSPFTLGRSLEGVNIQLEMENKSKYRFIAGRTGQADEALSVFQRQVFGVKTDRFFFQDSEMFSNFRLGVQAVTVQDDSATLKEAGSAKDLNNTVVSIDSEISLIKNFSVAFEAARSVYLEDEDALIRDRSYGSAIRIQPHLNLGKTSLRYLYYYVQPDFQTVGGSASPDKEQHQINADFRLNDRTFFSFVQNYYWDHLTGSSQTKRTTYNEQYTTLRFKPFLSRDRFETRLFVNRSDVNSDDTGNTAEAITHTLGWSINDVIGEKTNVGLSYEYRVFNNRANKTLSNKYHRIRANFGREDLVFNRRLYYSLSPSLDIRTTETDTNTDLNFSLSFNGQYDLAQRLQARFGHNLRSTNSAKLNSDSWNFQSHLEFDYALSQAKDKRMVLRLERNEYKYEDGGQNYNETRAILRFTANF